ncbi:MAG: CARDB domain-containing protein [Nitrososphaerota archaeon]
MKRAYSSSILLVLILASTGALLVTIGHPANSMWIEPSTVDATGKSVGERFNITIWLNVSVNCGAWQFYLIYNKQQLTVTKYGLTGTRGAISQFFEKCGSKTWGMNSDEGDHNATHKYLLIGESWKSGPWGTGCGSLAWIEFQIIAEPPEGGELTSVLDIASGHHPPTSDTLALDSTMQEIPLNVYNCVYTFKSQVTPPPPPPPPPSEVALISVYPPEIIDPTLMPCSEFSVNITISNVYDLKTVIFNLTFDPHVISLVSVSVIKVQGQTPTFKSIIDNECGFVWVKLTYPTPINVSGSQAILRVVFHVESFGLTVLDLHNSELITSSGQPIEHEDIDGFFCTLIRDAAITTVTLSSNWAYQGWEINITVTVKNKGIIPETFELSLYSNDTLIGSATILEIQPNEDRTILFRWNTTGVLEGNYTIKAEVEILPYELNTSDNQRVGGAVWVMTKIHDVALICLNIPTFAYQGWQVEMSATMRNMGEFPETFTVEVFVGDDLIESILIENLMLGSEMDVVFTWNTSTVAPCNIYSIAIKLSPLMYEFNLTNNMLFGTIKVRYMGDVDGDGRVDIKDIFAAALSYGAFQSTPRWNPAVDLDRNQKIDIRDIFIVAKNYGKGCE